MDNLSYFDRLVALVERIIRHACEPGTDQVVDQCLDNVDELMYAGRISPEQREALRLVLLGVTIGQA